MAPAYKLTYFDIRGLAEPARFLLNYGGLDFEDVRVQKEDWPHLKDKTPFGHLPVLEHKGVKVSQNLAICRYLAKVVKLAGNDDWENLEIDAVVDAITDLRLKISAAHWEKDEEKKKILHDTVVNETIPFYLTRFDALVEKNKGYLALGRLTWADLYWSSLGAGLGNFAGVNSFDKYANLKDLKDKVEALPAIKKWIETRPKTEF